MIVDLYNSDLCNTPELSFPTFLEAYPRREYIDLHQSELKANKRSFVQHFHYLKRTHKGKRGLFLKKYIAAKKRLSVNELIDGIENLNIENMSARDQFLKSVGLKKETEEYSSPIKKAKSEGKAPVKDEKKDEKMGVFTPPPKKVQNTNNIFKRELEAAMDVFTLEDLKSYCKLKGLKTID